MIRLRVLGSVELSGDEGGPLASILAQPKRLSLLAYLATAQPRGFHQRDSLRARFWPELDEPRARKALNQSVTFLRQELRDEGDVIVSRGADAIGIDAGRCWCDAVAFEDAARDGRPDEALELYRGGFLEGWFAESADGFEEWLERQRSRLRAMAAEAAVAVADARQRDGDYAKAIASARRAVELSHPDERTVRRLLALLDEAGDRASALREFSEFTRRLADDVGAEPSAETRALVDRIRLRANPVTREPTRPRSDLAAATAPAAQPAGAGAPLDRESSGPRRRARRAWIGGAAAAALVVAAVITWLELRPTVMRSAQSLAIAPFSVATGDTALVRLGQNLVTTLSANLDGIGELRVADAMSVLSHARTKGTLLSVEAAVDIARRLGVRSAGYGTLTPEGANVRADLTLYEVRNPESPFLRVSATAPIDSIAMLSDSLTWRLLREIWLKRKPPTPNVVAISTRSVVALRHFLDGERAFFRWDGPDAYEAYKRAIEADTTFWFAHYRYRVAHGWFAGAAVDTTITNRLSRHLAELPPRERRLLRAIDSTQTVTDRQRQLRALLDDNPDYTPAIYEYGDFIFHFGGFAGLDARDAIPYYRRLTQLVPSDVTSLSHYGALCMLTGDRSCVQQVVTQLDSVIASDPEPRFPRRLSRAFGLALHRPSPSWADSLAQLVVADTIVPGVCLPCDMGLFDQQPELLIELDRLYERIKARGRPDLAEQFQTFSALGRGDVARLDSIWTRSRTRPVLPSVLGPEVSIPEALTLAELQGLRDPSPATAEKALALVARTTATLDDRIRRCPECPPSLDRITGRWIAAASALWRADTTVFRAELDALGSDTTALARTASRSLNALRLGRLGGQPGRAAAAESLLVLERDNGEHFGQPRLWVALVADRIVGAQWLVEQGRYAPADSLLLYSRTLVVGDTDFLIMQQVTFGMTMLLRSQIAEALGNKEDAIAFAKTFLATFDMAPPAAKPWLDQARDRVKRVGGHLAAPQASPVRVR